MGVLRGPHGRLLQRSPQGAEGNGEPRRAQAPHHGRHPAAVLANRRVVQLPQRPGTGCDRARHARRVQLQRRNDGRSASHHVGARIRRGPVVLHRLRPHVGELWRVGRARHPRQRDRVGGGRYLGPGLRHLHRRRWLGVREGHRVDGRRGHHARVQPPGEHEVLP